MAKKTESIEELRARLVKIIATMRKKILQGRPAHRVSLAYNAQQAVFAMHEEIVYAWVDGREPLEVVLESLDLVKRFRMMLNTLPDLKRRKKKS